MVKDNETLHLLRQILSAVLVWDVEWEESKHPRGGNPENTGQFSKKGVSAAVQCTSIVFMKGLPIKRNGNVEAVTEETPEAKLYFQAKKEKNMDAARKTVARCIAKRKDEIADIAKKHPKAKVVPMTSAISKNCLPQALAEAIGLPIYNMIIQDKKYSHTGMNRNTRLFDKPNFIGKVQKDKEYIIADDVMTSGNSIKALADFIKKRGGKVVGAVVLSARFGASLVPTQEKIDAFNEKFSEEQQQNICKMLGVDSVSDLTPFQLAQMQGMKYESICHAYETYKKNIQNA